MNERYLAAVVFHLVEAGCQPNLTGGESGIAEQSFQRFLDPQDIAIEIIWDRAISKDAMARSR